MQILRRMMWIPQNARSTYEREMEIGWVTTELICAVRRMQFKLLGHILGHYCLEKDAFLGKIEGRRTWGRQRIKLTAYLKADIPKQMVAGLVPLAQDRNGLRFMVAYVNQYTAFRQGFSHIREVVLFFFQSTALAINLKDILFGDVDQDFALVDFIVTKYLNLDSLFVLWKT